ncbi:MAG: T9SS type A sorting domain-containing protein [Bacteroidetes bacterium]|nr:T9SS type A sorting domain-containing protein [Bacteroidota bacterium]
MKKKVFYLLLVILKTLQRPKQNLLLLLLLFNFLFCFAQSPLKVWDKRFAGDTSDYLNAIKRSNNGNLFLAGRSNSKNIADKSQTSKGGYDYWVIKTDSNGNKIWDITLGTTSNEDLFSVAPTPDGGCLVGGHTNGGKNNDKSQNSFGSNDYWVVKLNANGVKQWDSAYGGNSYDELHYVEPTTDKGFLLIGLSYSGKSGNKKSPNKGDADIWVVKIDSIGRMLWDSTYGGTGFDNCLEGKQTKDGGFLLASWSKSPLSGNKSIDSIGNSDVWLLKISGNGIVQWDRVYGGISRDEINTFVELPDGGFLLPIYSNSDKNGNKNTYNKGSYDTWLVRTNALGIKLWERSIGGNSDDLIFALVQTADRGFVLGGYSFSSTGDRSKFNYGGGDYWIIKVDSGGRPLWDETIGGKKDDYLQDMTLTAGDNIVLAGHSKSGIGQDKTQDTLNGNYDYWITKIRPPNFYINKHDTLLCPNDIVYAKYISTNNFADTNKIFFQLSDGYSNFANLATIGFKIGTKLKIDSILGLIPANAYAAPYYKFRLISTSPKDTSLWSFAVKILALPKKPLIIRFLDTLVCSNSNGVSYQWMKNNVPIAGATQRKFVPIVPAYYSVRVDSFNACPATSDPLAINNIGILNTANTLYIEASPNPFENTIILKINNIDIHDGTIEIFTVDGKIIYHSGIAADKIIIPTHQLMPGIYFIKVVNELGVGVLKMIKE